MKNELIEPNIWLLFFEFKLFHFALATIYFGVDLIKEHNFGFELLIQNFVVLYFHWHFWGLWNNNCGCAPLFESYIWWWWCEEFIDTVSTNIARNTQLFHIPKSKLITFVVTKYCQYQLLYSPRTFINSYHLQNIFRFGSQYAW